jgi:hypothetical protein
VKNFRLVVMLGVCCTNKRDGTSRRFLAFFLKEQQQQQQQLQQQERDLSLVVVLGSTRELTVSEVSAAPPWEMAPVGGSSPWNKGRKAESRTKKGSSSSSSCSLSRLK